MISSVSRFLQGMNTLLEIRLTYVLLLLKRLRRHPLFC